jgi:hypothetical protein
VAYLPPYEQAKELVEAYFEHAGWFYSPICKEEFWEEVMAAFYPNATGGSVSSNGNAVWEADSPSSNSNSNSTSDDSNPNPNKASQTPHTLSLLLLLLCLGLLVSPTHTAFDPNASLYFALAKAALQLDSVHDGTDIKLVQALNLVVYYGVQWSPLVSEQEGVWACMGVAGRVGLGVSIPFLFYLIFF